MTQPTKVEKVDPLVAQAEREAALDKLYASWETPTVEPTDWGQFNAQLRALYNHPQCEFCGEREACFCQTCIVPTYDELHRFVCHTCHGEHVGVETLRLCPTCRRPWPKEKAH